MYSRPRAHQQIITVAIREDSRRISYFYLEMDPLLLISDVLQINVLQHSCIQRQKKLLERVFYSVRGPCWASFTLDNLSVDYFDFKTRKKLNFALLTGTNITRRYPFPECPE